MKSINLTDLQITIILEALHKAAKQAYEEGATRTQQLCEDAAKAIKEQTK